MTDKEILEEIKTFLIITADDTYYVRVYNKIQELIEKLNKVIDNQEKTK